MRWILTLSLFLASFPPAALVAGAKEGLAHLEAAQKADNLVQAADEYRLAIKEDPSGVSGRQAALGLAKLEYAMGEPAEALKLLAPLSEADFEAMGDKGDLVFWRAQSDLLLKNWQKAQDGFEEMAKNHSAHPLADPAALGAADCDAALKNEEAALAGYQKLYQDPPTSVAPQALLKAARLHLAAGRPLMAQPLLDRLASEFPASYEADEALKLQGAPSPTTSTAVAEAKVSVQTAKPAAVKSSGIFTIQVGAFTRRIAADRLYAHLKRSGYKVRVEKRVLEDNILYLVQVGRFKGRAIALKAAGVLKRKEHLPAFRLVEIL